MRVRAGNTYKIETPEVFKQYLRNWAMANNTHLTQIGLDMGYSTNVLFNALHRQIISKAVVIALANHMHVSVDDILSHIQAPKVEEAPDEEFAVGQTVEDLVSIAQAVKDLTDAVDLLNEINKQQLQSLQQLAQMFARTWCK